MSTRRIIDDHLYAHFVTFGVASRRRMLDHDNPKRILLGVLNQQLQLQKAKLVGFVIMPDHVHMLVWFPEPHELSRFMHAVKRKSSFHIRNWYQSKATRYLQQIGDTNRLWTPKYHSFSVYSEKKLLEKLDYMHLNPVRAGLVERAADWRWSSACWYEERRTVGVPISWID